jgi:hypothetical protein
MLELTNRRQCDETWPTCLNCQKNGKCCPGPPARHTFKDLGPKLTTNPANTTQADGLGILRAFAGDRPFKRAPLTILQNRNLSGSRNSTRNGLRTALSSKSSEFRTKGMSQMRGLLVAFGEAQAIMALPHHPCCGTHRQPNTKNSLVHLSMLYALGAQVIRCPSLDHSSAMSLRGSDSTQRWTLLWHAS